MVDHHVAQRADRVVEAAAVVDPEVLRHRDLDAVEVVAAPDRLEDRVGEAQVQDLLEAHLPEVVVDPEQLRLVDVLVQLVGQVARGLLVVAERLLDDEARSRAQPGVGDALDDLPEQERRDLEVEDRGLGALDRLTDAPVRRGVGEVAADVGQPVGEPLEDLLVDRLPGPLDRGARPLDRAGRCVQSSTATPTIGQSRRPRASSRYSDRNVITLARSPVIPKTTKTSAGACAVLSAVVAMAASPSLTRHDAEPSRRRIAQAG